MPPSIEEQNNTCRLAQVTELKGLANHVVVGNVSCETKDLFAALPQTVAVDINDLGTIKLSLEVTWKYVYVYTYHHGCQQIKKEKGSQCPFEMRFFFNQNQTCVL